MDAGITSFPSILDKPLTQLTEEDISQVTREDCRKYLKEKGMRRPSWNKSQAIQQVISLKALLETSEDSGVGALRKILVYRPPVAPNSSDLIKESNAGAKNISVDDMAPCPQNDSPKSDTNVPLDCQVEAADNRAIACSSGATYGSAGQMTIFYCGKVNVYDGVLPDKAQAIMHLAASPFRFPVDVPISGTITSSLPFYLQMPGDKCGLVTPSSMICQTTQTDVEGQLNREVLLQRYREKRKDRVKIRKALEPTSTILDVHLNNLVRTHTSNRQPTRSSSSSPPQSRVQHALWTSAGNQAKTANLSVDLNKDVEGR